MRWIKAAIELAKKGRDWAVRRVLETKDKSNESSAPKEGFSYGRKDVERKADIASSPPDRQEYRDGKEAKRAALKEDERWKKKAKASGDKDREVPWEKENPDLPSELPLSPKEEREVKDYHPRYLPPELPDSKEDYDPSDDRGFSL